MAGSQDVNDILAKLKAHSALTAEEISTLQTHIDQLENRAIAEGTHHDTHSTPATHFSQHHSSILEQTGFLDKDAEEEAGPSGEEGKGHK